MSIARTLHRSKLLLAVLPVALVFAFQGCSLVGYSPQLATIAVTPTDTTIARGTTQQLSAWGTYGDATEQDVTADAGWASSDSEVATVSGGLVTPVGAGTVVITASLRGVSGTASITVTNALLQSIEVTPANPTITNGTHQQFTATGHYDDGNALDITSQVTWSSSDTSVTISNDAGSKGLAASTALGDATSRITATMGTISDQTDLTVKGAGTLSSLSVSPASATIKVRQTQQFTANGTFADGSSQDMTGEVAWTSSATRTATIDASGLATAGTFAGAATITATSSALLGSLSATAQLTVQSASGGY